MVLLLSIITINDFISDTFFLESNWNKTSFGLIIMLILFLKNVLVLIIDVYFFILFFLLLRFLSSDPKIKFNNFIKYQKYS